MRKLLLIFVIVLSLCGLTACSENNNIEESNTSPSSTLSENIINHIGEWEYVCDSFTQSYSNDDIEATGICLYSSGTKGEYYFGALYTMPSNGVRVLTTYQRIYYVTDSTFEYVYGSEYTAEDETVKNHKILAMQFPSKGSNKTEYVKQLVDEGLNSEN